ncbi:Beta-galactosidase [Hibiscus syriacus]|uniref:beta-galactosidase n=1 Tax=Hibiscus syriacus TaxID=106335 RepID=A0A6A2Z7C5_HIBSY|nr:Beta-galactosidase [Hibiscus syriacus]
MKIFKFFFHVVVFSSIIFHVNAHNVTHDSRSIIIDGTHRIILSGSIHYPRSTAQKAKEGGLDAVETYVFWNAHEPIENEYGNVMKPYGEDGKSYINWCAQMADSMDIGVPWIMCQQAGAPKPMTPIPLKCELKIGLDDPLRTAEDLAFSVARFFQKGGTLQNYYMYHGGTNFGRTLGGLYMTTSYDYNAPLDEYGNLNQPKWGHLKQLHDVLHSIEYTLTHGDVHTQKLDNSVTATVYQTNDKSSCFLSNSNTTTDVNVNFGGIDYFVPAWSISILPDCRKGAYNTANVYAQTSMMIKKSNKAEDEPDSLKWTWRPELIESASVQGKGDVSVNRIVIKRYGK